MPALPACSSCCAPISRCDYGRPGARGRPPACRRDRARRARSARRLGRADGLAEAGADAAAAAFAALRDARHSDRGPGTGQRSGIGLLPDPLPADMVRIDGGWFRPSPARPRPPGFSRRWSAPTDRAAPRSWSTGLRPRRHCASPSIRGRIFSAARCLPRRRSPARCFPTSRCRSKRLLAERRVIPSVPLIRHRRINGR